jgi:hypothetical protein
MLVTFAVILLTLGMTIRFTYVFSSAHVEKPVTYVVLAVVIGVPYLVIWFIFLGKNWARWAFLVVFGMALCSLSASIQRLLAQTAWGIVVYSAQVLLGLIAAVALLSDSSANWFRQMKNDTHNRIE